MSTYLDRARRPPVGFTSTGSAEGFELELPTAPVPVRMSFASVAGATLFAGAPAER